MSNQDHPGIYIPVPLFFIAFFFFSYLLQTAAPFDISFLHSQGALIVGWIFVAAGVAHVIPAWVQFIRSCNSVVTIKPARTLQTNGVYAFSRNPMYIGFYFLYLGFALLYGNLWTFIVMPVLALIINLYVIKREERYLRRKFGREYKSYKKSVRRWL
ncbi:methyltransferase family protein [Arachidicoccus sp.]|jgi:protein-S-isoprenylcysteine O-methyltransferase Ste14|uniref:methyltransferase family protein n=1 Tax=Arachidicoccus sp. TaxID=1872624 RepID=UPI003D25D9A3